MSLTTDIEDELVIILGTCSSIEGGIAARKECAEDIRKAVYRICDRLDNEKKRLPGNAEELHKVLMADNVL